MALRLVADVAEVDGVREDVGWAHAYQGRAALEFGEAGRHGGARVVATLLREVLEALGLGQLPSSAALAASSAMEARPAARARAKAPRWGSTSASLRTIQAAKMNGSPVRLRHSSLGFQAGASMVSVSRRAGSPMRSHASVSVLSLGSSPRGTSS